MYEIFSCARYLAQQGENISSGHMVAVLSSKDLGRTSAPPTFQKLLANCHQDGKKCTMHAVTTLIKEVNYGYESRYKETVMVKMDMKNFIVEHRWQISSFQFSDDLLYTTDCRCTVFGLNVPLEKLDHCLLYWFWICNRFILFAVSKKIWNK